MKHVFKISFLCLGLFVCFNLTLISCTGDDDDENDNDSGSAFFPPAAGTSWMYRVFFDSAGDLRFDAAVTVIGSDTQKFPGESYIKVEMGDSSDEQSMAMIGWVDLNTYGRIGLKAYEVYYYFDDWEKEYKIRNRDYDHFEVYDQPVYMLADKGLNIPQTSSSTGVIYFEGGAYSEPCELTITVTVLSDSETVTVPYGTVNNCKLVDFQIHHYFYKFDDYFSATHLYHDDLGLVWADMIPGFSTVQLIAYNGAAS